MYLGVIADDFTGGTDIAGFLVQNGLSVTQYIGVPEKNFTHKATIHAAIISLKSRSCPVNIAIQDSLAALQWLKEQGCKQVFFKYCSTFDSTPQGNIGPVTDALLEALESDVTVIAPSLPINGRTVYQGYLFVFDQLLNESGMKNHPVTPMHDANLMRLMEAQAKGKAANLPYTVLEQGLEAVVAYTKELQSKGIRYIVADALTDEHLCILGHAVETMPLVTGGSGLGMGIAGRIASTFGITSADGAAAGMPLGGPCVVFSGSASVMTNAQVEEYKNVAASIPVDVQRCIKDAQGYAHELAHFVSEHLGDAYAPMVYATVGPKALESIQKEFGAENASKAVESVFAALAKLLRDIGCNHFIVAGGETSGAVVQALNVQAFVIGPQIAPGVPWVRAVNADISLALKSGNFGTSKFFLEAQRFYK